MIIAILAVLGLCAGSFINALVWRVHEQAKPKNKRKLKKQKELSIVHGRSACVHCGYQLQARDLLPVISWLSLGGKCRYCHKKIAYQYPLVELSTSALFVASYLWWPAELSTTATYLQLGLWLVGIILLVALLVYDMRWMLLPNRLVYPFIGLAGVFAILEVSTFGITAFWSVIAAVLCSAGLFYLLFVLSDGKWIGGGDVKLAIGLGFFLGSPIQAVLMIFVASLLGSLLAAPALIKGKASRATRIPFGPFLIIATITVFLFGSYITEWYQRIFLGL